ncbi:hypothetical protein BCR44DRAFT_1434629 [Catenaria anguillulae PL171]|uniref:Uncharacterized protein n=1 Tax=Catenaria anguillulae PL171 TaxID=765915 RepID=A0A1Y2HN46_9FUNG|nr:hypothetical protein BCR44DRAFT_1434629 [Catenaria anguillulae PL171]
MAPDGSGDPVPSYPPAAAAASRPRTPPVPTSPQEEPPVLLSPRRPPSYREIDLPSPMSVRLDASSAHAAQAHGKKRMVVDIVVRHELVVEAQVGKEEVEVAIPVLVNEGDDTCREEILRHVCA